MSEFCEHIEQGVIGWRSITYEESLQIHKRGPCPLCQLENLDVKEKEPVKIQFGDTDEMFIFWTLCLVIIAIIGWHLR